MIWQQTYFSLKPLQHYKRNSIQIKIKIKHTIFFLNECIAHYVYSMSTLSHAYIKSDRRKIFDYNNSRESWIKRRGTRLRNASIYVPHPVASSRIFFFYHFNHTEYQQSHKNTHKNTKHKMLYKSNTKKIYIKAKLYKQQQPPNKQESIWLTRAHVHLTFSPFNLKNFCHIQRPRVCNTFPIYFYNHF